MVLRNVCNCIPISTASYPRRLEPPIVLCLSSKLFKTYEQRGTLWTDYAVVRLICGSVNTYCMEQWPVTSIHTYLHVVPIMCSVSLGFLIEPRVLGMLYLSNF